MNDFEILREKIEKELKEFRDSYNNMDVIQTYNDWYIIGFYESYAEMLACDYIEQRNVNDVIEWLSSKNSPLSFLYDKWLSCDDSMSHDWDDMIDFVLVVYTEEKHLEKQNLYSEIKALDLKSIKNASDEYFSEYDWFTHISHSPCVFSAKLPNNMDANIDKKFSKFFEEHLLIKSCDYGCDTYPDGISRKVAEGNVQTYQQPVWNFIEGVEQMFNCKCNYFENVNGFEFVFEFGSGDNKGCYVFGAGNNGQEFSQVLNLKNPEQIHDAEIIKAITTIDKALYVLLEEQNLKRLSKEKVPLEEQIAEINNKSRSSIANLPVHEEVR